MRGRSGNGRSCRGARTRPLVVCCRLFVQCGVRSEMQKVAMFVAAMALSTVAALSLGATAQAELIPGGWLTMPRIPDPPPEAAAPAGCHSADPAAAAEGHAPGGTAAAGPS